MTRRERRVLFRPRYGIHSIAGWGFAVGYIAVSLGAGTPAWAVTPGGMANVYYILPTEPVTTLQTGYEAIASHLTIEIEPGPVYYFWAQQFWFVGGDGGYIGLQTNGLKKGQEIGKMAIFSIWQALAATPAENCEPFGGEGEGYSCRIAYPWVEGHEYRLQVREECCSSEPSQPEWWSAWVRDETSRVETYIGQIQVPAAWSYLQRYANVFAE